MNQYQVDFKARGVVSCDNIRSGLQYCVYKWIKTRLLLPYVSNRVVVFPSAERAVFTRYNPKTSSDFSNKLVSLKSVCVVVLNLDQ